ncbi:MAG: hypothetical protein II264_04580 [Ruminococcus sp.]|nr:hypothetical protein [Ruminococcus sp.]
MMREILFRGKRSNNGEWVEGNYLAANCHWHKRGIHRDWIVCNAYANGGWVALGVKYPVITGTVGQCIGLDKNGKKIFEGDICKNRWGSIGVVKLGRFKIDCCGCCYEYHDAIGYFLVRKNGDIVYDVDENVWDYVEVIGNIHDNPELVEELKHDQP